MNLEKARGLVQKTLSLIYNRYEVWPYVTVFRYFH
jgi:ABC-type arginine transport system ATPase subunit